MSQTHEHLVVILSSMEVELAGLIGAKRRSISLMHQRESRRDFTRCGIENDIEAVAAEMSVAKALNIYPEWSTTDKAVPRFDLTYRRVRIDVKSTQYLNGNLLIPKLQDNRIYVLVRGQIPKYQIVGFIHGLSVKTKGAWTNQSHIPCWTVPANNLSDITILKGRKEENDEKASND